MTISFTKRHERWVSESIVLFKARTLLNVYWWEGRNICSTERIVPRLGNDRPGAGREDSWH
jgi:hypothetical protein